MFVGAEEPEKGTVTALKNGEIAASRDNIFRS